MRDSVNRPRAHYLACSTSSLVGTLSTGRAASMLDPVSAPPPPRSVGYVTAVSAWRFCLSHKRTSLLKKAERQPASRPGRDSACPPQTCAGLSEGRQGRPWTQPVTYSTGCVVFETHASVPSSAVSGLGRPLCARGRAGDLLGRCRTLGLFYVEHAEHG